MELRENEEEAIVIRGACKEYVKGKKVLDGLNMTVKKGTIYGLLGASGCGKTTLLSSVVGIRKLKKGLISIFGYSPDTFPYKAIGYMPQETSLLEQFTVRDCLKYQGYIYGMSDEKIKERHEFLDKLLELPPGDRIISQLSGGEQRRVSLAVTVIHDPDILILDEPTVGLDPVLRQKLWDYFIKITQEDNKTIIITTHYLEEAKQANTIGLLRMGKILAEGEPQVLLRKYNCVNIEDTFALLSVQQNELIISTDPPKKDEGESSKINESSADIRFIDAKNRKKSNFINKWHAKAILLKNFVRFTRNPEIFLLAIILPIFALLTYFPSTGVLPSDMQIGIVNEELEDFKDCNEYLLNYNSTGGKIITEDEESICVYNGISCLFIENIGSLIAKKIYYKTEEEALKAMKKGQFHLILHFPQNFSESITEIKKEQAFFHDGDLTYQYINVLRDVKDFSIGALVEKELYDTYQRFAGKLTTDCGYSEKAEQLPIKFEEPVYGKLDDYFYAKFTVPGVVLLYTVISASGLSLVSYTAERQSGVWERTLVAGITTNEILFYDSTFLAFISLVQVAIIYVISFVIFQSECIGNVFYVLLLLYINSICGVFEGAMISINCKTVQGSLYLGVGIFLTKLFSCGVIWPIQGITFDFFRYLCYLAPQSYSIEALRMILYRGWGISHLQVLIGFLTPIIYAILFAAISVITLKFEKK